MIPLALILYTNFLLIKKFGTDRLGYHMYILLILWIMKLKSIMLWWI